MVISALFLHHQDKARSQLQSYPMWSNMEISETNAILQRGERLFAWYGSLKNHRSWWNITPVHKKDLPEPAENYRPILILLLLLLVSKVMERCVCNRLYSHVSQSITSLQHGVMRLTTFVRSGIQLGRHFYIPSGIWDVLSGKIWSRWFF